jgi:hypothetical protein
MIGAQGSGDFVGTSTVPIAFADCARIVGGTGKIVSAIFIDGDVQSAAVELWIFNFPITTLGNDNAAFTVSDAEMKAYFVGIIPFAAANYYASALNSVCLGVPAKDLYFQCQPTSRILYAALVSRGTPTYTTNVPYFTLNIIQD